MPADSNFVKIPDRNVLDFNMELASVDEIENLFIFDIGGVELSQVLDYQTVYGTNSNYFIVKDIEKISVDDDPKNFLLSLGGAVVGNNFSIDYEQYLRTQERTPISINAFGEIEVSVEDLPETLFIEIQIDQTATMYYSKEPKTMNAEPDPIGPG